MKSATSLGGKLGGMPSLASLGNFARGCAARMSVNIYPAPKLKKLEEAEYKPVDFVKRADYSKPKTNYETPAYGKTGIGVYKNLPQAKHQIYMTAGVAGDSEAKGYDNFVNLSDYRRLNYDYENSEKRAA